MFLYQKVLHSLVIMKNLMICHFLLSLYKCMIYFKIFVIVLKKNKIFNII